MDEYYITYNGVQIKVDPKTFSQSSPVFNQYYDPEQTMIINTNEMTFEEFEKCLPAVQGKPYHITRDNIEIMRKFAEDWQVSEIDKKIQDFETNNKINSTISNFVQRCSKGQPVDDLIPQIASDLNSYIKNCTQFVTIAPKYMKKILKNESCNIKDYHAFFNFLLGYAGIHKSQKGKSILNYLDLKRLNSSEIDKLFEIHISNQGSLSNSNISDLLKNMVFFLHDKCKEAQQTCEAGQRELDDKKSKLRTISYNIEETKKKLNKFQNNGNGSTNSKFYYKPPPSNNKPYKKRHEMSQKDFVYTPPPDSNGQ